MNEYKICEKCYINYHTNEDVCDSCKEPISESAVKHKNKSLVEKYLLPLLYIQDKEHIELLTKKNASKEIFYLHFPLLVKCGESFSKQDIKDDKGRSRYYAKPYLIQGKFYYVCSQWGEIGGKSSRDKIKNNIFKLLEQLKAM